MQRLKGFRFALSLSLSHSRSLLFSLCLPLSFSLVPLPLVFMTSLKYIAFKMAASVCMWLCRVHLCVRVCLPECVCKDIGTCFLCSVAGGIHYSTLSRH